MERVTVADFAFSEKNLGGAFEHNFLPRGAGNLNKPESSEVSMPRGLPGRGMLKLLTDRDINYQKPEWSKKRLNDCIN